MNGSTESVAGENGRAPRAPAGWRRAVVVGLCLLAAGGPAAGAARGQGTRVRLVLAIDGKSGLPGLDVNVAEVLGMFRPVADEQGGVVVTALGQEEIGPDGIVHVFDRLPDVRPTDVLVFYYAGHGATDPRPGFGHLLQTSGGDLLRSRLREAIVGRRPRLAVILTDCCSSVARFRPPLTAPAPQAPGEVPEVGRVMKDLFFRHAGLVDVTGASYDAEARRGEYGWFSSTGGVFTRCLSQAARLPYDQLDRSRDGLVTWAEFTRELRSVSVETFRTFKQVHLERARDDPDADPATVQRLAEQQSQVPQTFSLGTPVNGRGPREHFAGNLGITYELVPYGATFGARLTQPPAPGGPAARLRLEPGDLIVDVDDLPFRAPVDLQLHYGASRFTFVDVRTGRRLVANADLGPRNLVDTYAPALGVCYVLYPYGDAFGARLTRYPTAGSPAAGLRLEPGDMIVALDGTPIRSDGDVVNHVGQTTLDFVNVRTGGTQAAVVQLPAAVQPATTPR